MPDLTPEQMRRMHDFAEQLAELAEHQEDQWKVQTTDGQIFLTLMSPTAPHGLNFRKSVPYAFGDTVTAGRWTLDTSSLRSYPADW
ncbi:hypothetical protein ACFYYM_33025 [Streptomyces erythrochromogenes]|uniref:hypothetical protein n=1 Tax=Streptomyces erythrochromogenes TaxID=285574 RepID=UPI0036CEB043